MPREQYYCPSDEDEDEDEEDGKQSAAACASIVRTAYKYVFLSKKTRKDPRRTYQSTSRIREKLW